MKFPTFPLLVLALSAAGAGAAAPLNDAFASRLPLGRAATASAAGTNAGATLEVDENDLDSIGGASVWWKWTAPATGWVSIDTAGSAIDTVLAVLADGPTLDDAYVVGVNDESGDPAAPAGTSRVIFQAVADTEYHIAVHGFLGQQGAVAVRVQSGVTPPFRVNALVLAPAGVDVTTATQVVSADIAISSEEAIAEGVLALHRANFSGITEIPLLPTHRISGTPTDGVYRLNFAVPRYSTPGTWLLEVAVSDALGREAVFGRGVSAIFEYDHVLPDGLTGLLSVANAGIVDDLPPTLPTFTRAPAAVTVVASAAMITFTFQVVDDLSGFGSASLTLVAPNGEALATVPVGAGDRLSGTPFDGIYRIPFTLPPRMPGGTWTVSLLVRDATGNPSLIDGAIDGEDFPLGPASAEISVTGAPHGYWAWMYPRVVTDPGTQPTDDLDGDGVSNLLEFAFGLSPTVSDPVVAMATPGVLQTGLPTSLIGPDGLSLSYTRRAGGTLSGLTYTAQFGSALDSWTNASGGTITAQNESLEQVSVSDPVPGGGRRFGRVTVDLAQ